MIPALDEEMFIEDCIRSIQAQQDQPHEIIVVDNGSTDQTAALAQQLGCIVVREEKRGLSHARNRGALAASGDIVCFIDADCRLSKGWLRSARRCFARSGIGAVLGPSIYVHASLLKRLWYNLYVVGVVVAVAVSQVFFRRMVFTGNNLAIRRDLFLQLGGYEPVIGEGYWFSRRFWRQSAYQGRFCARMILWNSPRGFEHHGFIRTLAYWIRGTLRRVSQEGYTYKTY
ncbi:MAG: glycosyltransferase family A protein [Oscillochloridaceae bacterium]|nr:glycosyltransferase family 2 protein [Chloroflexaceae bacterium]MDW8388997.1 glycosyltransferase family A protein [Oscillochloridaceae bacterium]